MKRAAVIGDPIAQSKSPMIHGFWLDRLGMAGRYEAIHVTEAELSKFIAALPDSELSGINVTIPHKEAVMRLVDQVTPAAQAVGAVNTVVVAPDGLIGNNTDVDGVRAALAGAKLKGAKVVMIGAGGAARAALYELRAAGVGEVHILTRTVARGERLLSDFGLAGTVQPAEYAEAALENATLLINASPAGMTGKAEMGPEILAAMDRLAPDALVFDMVYQPLETALLKRARALGRRTSDGLVMLIGQARTAFAAFYGVEPPADPESDAALRAVLTS